MHNPAVHTHTQSKIWEVAEVVKTNYEQNYVLLKNELNELARRELHVLYLEQEGKHALAIGIERDKKLM